MRHIKQLLPNKLKLSLRVFLTKLEFLLIRICKTNNFLSSIYYSLISNEFRREHHAVLTGKYLYHKNLFHVENSSSLLRRNIHRLEKGLIMRDRKKTFAENYIKETIEVYKSALKSDSFDKEEKKWASDVLRKYFECIQPTPLISQAMSEFYENETLKVDTKSYVPYSAKSLPLNSVTYDQLSDLFKRRRANRSYIDKKVEISMIEKAIEIAKLAPSACNRQPFRFYVSQNKDQACKVAKCAGGTSGWAEDIPCTVVIIGDLSLYPRERDRHLIYIDSSLAAMQFMLALETLGLSSCPINWPDVEHAEKKLAKLISLNIYDRPIMMISVGYADIDNGKIPFSQKKQNYLITKKI